ncbi:MAG: AarF/ABC1/UbiB kinase family protein [Pseudomonadota bacterium]
MSPKDQSPRALRVPQSRFGRLARMGGLATSVASDAALGGLKAAANGNRPSLRSLVMTPANAARFADELARMRGAAMKVGQLLSMDAGELLPPDLAQILARLRAEAHYMPPRQLREVLNAAWGDNWIRRFRTFDVRPIAAASIGQVHRAETRDGRQLAIKVQYPGVKRSIDSDVSNVAGLIRMSGMIPRDLDIAPLLKEAKLQLHEEADYTREAAYLQRYGALLEDAPGLRVPAFHGDFSTDTVLAMDYLRGQLVEDLVEAPEDQRADLMARLLQLLFRELFDFGVMQTDPNFANYRVDPDSGDLILLDFGAARDIPPELAAKYRALLGAGLAGDRRAIEEAAVEMGLFAAATEDRHKDMVLGMVEIAMAPLRAGGVIDFADDITAARLRDAGMALGLEGDFWHVPPPDILLVQRKLAGMYLLGRRLRARVGVAALLAQLN